MTQFTTEIELLRRLRALPPDKQAELLDFAEFLRHKTPARVHPARLRGMCADLHLDVSANVIDEARKELWGEFPRSLEP